MKKIIIKNAKKDLISRKHHWIFSGAIHKKDPSIVNMDQVEVIDSQENFLCQGLYHDASIAVRIYSFDKSEDINSQSFWNDRIQSAYRLRKTLKLPNKSTNMFRLVHGEGDKVPGLVIDIYNDHAVIQLHYPGLEPFLNLIESSLKNLPVEIKKAVIKKTYVKSVDNNQLDSEILIAIENEVKFEIDLINGQKTGFFIDQRENRSLVGSLSENKSVLNLFAYNGGFSMYALKAGATEVCSVEISAKAIESLERNINLNQLSTETHTSVVADVMEYIQTEPLDQDIIIVDPPAFAKHKSKRHNAIQAYKRLNSKVFKNAKAGALVFTFSCSQVITKDIFRNTIYSAALESGRSIKVIKELNQGYDHPVNIYHPETDYLKGLMLYIQ
jgi:23S rRNA (cytosine1962-C5)-methyltransferase